MGCASSKTVDGDVYRPAPSSFAVFDINAIQEPWLNDADPNDPQDEKSSHVPPLILEKLRAIEDAPRTWDEVRKELEDIKPKLKVKAESPPKPKNKSYRTLEELEANIATKSSKIESPESKKKTPIIKVTEPKLKPNSNGDVPKSLKDNIFIVRDKMERENAGKPAGFVKRDPLSDFEEICPPGGEQSVVVYSTSLGGVRRTYEDCNQVRQLMETHQIVYDERDVALDIGFLNEVRELLGEGVTVPRVFVNGRYLGGVEEVVELNERGRLSRILNWAKVERGVGRQGCGGCGGARFVPCVECGGSCKVVALAGDNKERCGLCNENGLVHCPLCL